ncbi:MAG: hypothetical protein E7538_02240 [Ruminococcaceae bacterium]|nr:hypothetical protein [Oscillospiraceae bacterium]
MTEKQELISHILDLKEKSATESIITSSSFLSVDELSDVIKEEKVNNRYVDAFYYGGYEDAERKTAVFVPTFYGVNEDKIESFLNENECNPVSLLLVKKDKFTSLTHRDYLGALMGLGLKREVIGDIVASDDGCSIFCLKSVAAFIAENLRRAGRGSLTVTVADKSKMSISTAATETVFVSVASMRLDCLVAAVFRLSRPAAAEAIKQGLVYVNSAQLLKCDHNLKKGDKLVLRGKGKALIGETQGHSKKGRIHLNIKRYL